MAYDKKQHDVKTLLWQKKKKNNTCFLKNNKPSLEYP